MNRSYIARGIFAVGFAMLVTTFKASAAVLLGSVNTNPGVSNVDLTAMGDVDWAIWHYTNAGSPGVASVSPTNYKAGGPQSIGAITTVGTGAIGLRGSGTGSFGSQAFSYTNGNSPTTLVSAQQSLVFANPLNTDNVGVQLSISGNPGQLLYVNVWATGFLGQGTMTASLNGTSNVVLLSQTYAAVSPKAPTLFTFTFQPNSASDKLTLQYVLTEPSGASSHVGIQAITISTTPEPSVALLGMAAFIGLAGVRRRSRR